MPREPFARLASALLRRGGSPAYYLENARLLEVLLGVGESLMAVAVIVSLKYDAGPTVGSRAFAIALVAAGSAFLALAMIHIWNNSVIKPREVERIVSQVPWGGDEVVADVVCGSALAAERSGERLSSGLSVGVDVWAQARKSKGIFAAGRVQQSGPVSALAFADADSRSLPLRVGSVDAVFSGFGTRRFRRLADRISELEEMLRVLKPGGSIVVMTPGDPVEYEVLMRRNGLVEVQTSLVKSFLIFTTYVVSARKLAQPAATAA